MAQLRLYTIDALTTSGTDQSGQHIDVVNLHS